MKNYYVSNKSNVPIYQQLNDQMIAQILSGELESNSLLPSIRTMAKELRVSVITIKKTWEELEKKGYIYTVAGKGSYVNENTVSELNKKKMNMVKDMFNNNIKQCKQLSISKSEIIKIVSEIYDNI